MKRNFNIESYKKHASHWQEHDDISKLESWSKKNTIDAWLHLRMYKLINPLLKEKSKKWLTVGDGRYGSDANYIISQGLQDVTASDISTRYLKLANKNGFINEFSEENAECLSFNDNSFDFVLCKEAFHHFPRPFIALYEMLRVAKDGVVLLEPNDQNIEIYRNRAELLPTLVNVPSKIQIIKDFVKDIFGVKRYKLQYPYPAYHNDYQFGLYEPDTANYVYTISEREIEKIALALNYDAVAFKYLSFYYEPGVEFEIANDNNPMFLKIKEKIAEYNSECDNGKMNYNFLSAIIFKIEPENIIINDLINNGYNYIRLPNNPHV